MTDPTSIPTSIPTSLPTSIPTSTPAPAPTPPTKWSVLQHRLDEANAQATRLRRELASLERTPCNLNCSGCGVLLETEADFAQHFVLSDTRYLNLGECPTRIGDPTS
jgi:hypothetical protein